MRLLMTIMALGLSFQLQAVDKMFVDPTTGYNQGFEEEAPWKEAQASLPDFPKSEHLQAITVSPTARHTYLIDASSLTVGEDGVVRYTLVVKSANGSENVSHEGLRCEEGQRKVYALGRPNGEWVRNPRANWSPIAARDPNSPHRVLFFHYLCTQNTKRDTPTLQRILRSGGIYLD